MFEHRGSVLLSKSNELWSKTLFSLSVWQHFVSTNQLLLSKCPKTTTPPRPTLKIVDCIEVNDQKTSTNQLLLSKSNDFEEVRQSSRGRFAKVKGNYLSIVRQRSTRLPHSCAHDQGHSARCLQVASRRLVCLTNGTQSRRASKGTLRKPVAFSTATGLRL